MVTHKYEQIFSKNQSLFSKGTGILKSLSIWCTIKDDDALPSHTRGTLILFTDTAYYTVISSTELFSGQFSLTGVVIIHIKTTAKLSMYI